ncbi:MAG: prefoldin beta subunit [archaeon GW2011_AR5]|nr:MAG: prefoldin beta subunit [archaeon GW2011_AR5]
MGELENLIGHLQMQNQQLQAVLMQKQALSMQSREIEKALEHLETASDDVYRTVGPILVKVPGGEVKKQLEDDKEEVDLKLKTIESQEKKLRDKLKESQEKIQGMMPQGQGG